MKTRESGMPEESVWDGFFVPESVLRCSALLLSAVTLLILVAATVLLRSQPRIVAGTVHALDIEPEMIRITEAKAEAAGLRNIKTYLRDFVAVGSGLPGASADYAMLFNILHAENPQVLLEEASRVLRPGGLLAITHWRYDPTTPRGPSMSIRPRPEQCCQWAGKVGFQLLPPGILDLPPYHYGMVFQR